MNCPKHGRSPRSDGYCGSARTWFIYGDSATLAAVIAITRSLTGSRSTLAMHGLGKRPSIVQTYVGRDERQNLPLHLLEAFLPETLAAENDKAGVGGASATIRLP